MSKSKKLGKISIGITLIFFVAFTFLSFRSLDREQRELDRQFDSEQRELDREMERKRAKFEIEQRELDRQLQRELAKIKNCKTFEDDRPQDKPVQESESPQD